MVKEVFVIRYGSLIFYYSPHQSDEGLNQAILSSGLLDAVRSFTEEARDETIDSFSMKNEKILFRKLKVENTTLAVVFDNDVSDKLSQRMLLEIDSLINNSEFIKDLDSMTALENTEKKVIGKKISELSNSMFLAENEEEYIIDLLTNRQDIPLGFLLNSETKECIGKFSRPKALFKDIFISEFSLLLSNITNVTNRIKFGDSYHCMTILSSEYSIASVFSGNKISLASSSLMTNLEDVLQAAFEMCKIKTNNPLSLISDKKEILKSSSFLSNNGNLSNIEGDALSPMFSAFFSALINNINRFFKLINKRDFEQFSIFCDSIIIQKLIIKKVFSNKKNGSDYIIKLMEYK